MLFVIVIDAIIRKLVKAMNEGRLSGFRVGNSVENTLMVSHRLFANNTLIFCGTDMDQLLIFCLVFISSKAVLGLKINLGKSKLVHVGAVPNIEESVDVLVCKWGSLPMKHIGLPLGDKFKEKMI